MPMPRPDLPETARTPKQPAAGVEANPPLNDWAFPVLGITTAFFRVTFLDILELKKQKRLTLEAPIVLSALVYLAAPEGFVPTPDQIITELAAGTGLSEKTVRRTLVALSATSPAVEALAAEYAAAEAARL